jgi:nitronate monooxygenase
LHACRSLTDKPFAVNLTVGVVASEINYDDYVDVIVNSGVKIVETAGAEPGAVYGPLQGRGYQGHS